MEPCVTIPLEGSLVPVKPGLLENYVRLTRMTVLITSVPMVELVRMTLPAITVSALKTTRELDARSRFRDVNLTVA